MAIIKQEDITIQAFDCFKVYSSKQYYSFQHIAIEDKPAFYEKLFEHYFSEEKLIKYCEHMSNIKFAPSDKHFAILHKHLKTYIDDKNLIVDISDLEERLVGILFEEQDAQDNDGRKYIRSDKVGKMGEYIFCCILSEFFHFDCIIPKVHLQTDYNMNVYGIDALFYCEKDNLLLFGESKLSKKLNNGINLIKKSLSEYEKQLADEFEIVLSSRLYKDRLYKFNDNFGDVAEVSIDINQFISKANIKQIGIPLFIAHGTETDPVAILNKLKNLPTKKFFELDTRYYSISLPIINKNKFIATITKKIREKEDYYKNEITK